MIGADYCFYRHCFYDQVRAAFMQTETVLENQIAEASNELHSGDLQTAFVRVEALLWLYPNNIVIQALADEILQASRDPLVFTQLSAASSWKGAAMRARALVQTQHFVEAVNLLMELCSERASPHLVWVLTWLDVYPAMTLQLTVRAIELQKGLGRILTAISDSNTRSVQIDFANLEALVAMLGVINENVNQKSAGHAEYRRALKLLERFDKKHAGI